MTNLRLPAGTDVAEMAFFDIDAIPVSRPPDEQALSDLAARDRLIRLSTGSDGGYLLHLYVDEPIPSHVAQYCVNDDKLSGKFTSTIGRVAFGGVESAFRDFKPNRNIRSDGVVTPGTYLFTAHHTEFPDELVEKAIEVASTPEERWLDRAPVLVTLVSFATAFALAVTGLFLIAGLVLVCWHFSLKAVKRHPASVALSNRREAAQLDFPSIVIELRSN